MTSPATAPPGRTGSPAEAKGLVLSRITRRLDGATLKPISASQLTQPKLVNLNPECTKGLSLALHLRRKKVAGRWAGL